MKAGMYITARGPISTAYFLNSSRQSLGLCISLSLLGNGSVNTFPWQGRIIGDVIFYAVQSISYQRRVDD
jgi:hypothetical protein